MKWTIRFVAAGSLVLAGLVAAQDEPPVPDPKPISKTPDEDVEAGVVYLNQIRIGLGLPPVDYDEATSRHCARHGRYINRHGGGYAHQENPKHPDYDEDAARVAGQSVISMGPTSCVEGARNLLNTFLHRIPLLRPELASIGLARVGGVVLYEYQTGLVRDPATFEWTEPILYPADGWKDIPVNWSGESPRYYRFNPARSGSPITATFPPGQRVTDVEFVLRRSGRSMAFYIWTPEDPAHEMWPDNMNSVSVFPRAVLQLDSTYECHLECKVDGESKIYDWSFETLSSRRR